MTSNVRPDLDVFYAPTAEEGSGLEELGRGGLGGQKHLRRRFWEES